MHEQHLAYKIVKDGSGLVCTHTEFTEDKMIDLLIEIQQKHSKGIYWVFKQLDNKPQEALCIIDCQAERIYYHYSGEVEDLTVSIQKLSQSNSTL